MLYYTYSDISDLFDLISNYVKQPGDCAYVDELHDYISYNGACKILDRILNGGITADDHRFIRDGIQSMKTKGEICMFNVFGGYHPIDLKGYYHQTINVFGPKSFDLIENNNIFGKAYCNAMKRCNKSSNKLDCIPNARMIFEELKKLLKRMENNGYKISNNVRMFME